MFGRVCLENTCVVLKKLLICTCCMCQVHQNETNTDSCSPVMNSTILDYSSPCSARMLCSCVSSPPAAGSSACCAFPEKTWTTELYWRPPQQRPGQWTASSYWTFKIRARRIFHQKIKCRFHSSHKLTKRWVTKYISVVKYNVLSDYTICITCSQAHEA